MNRRHFLKLSAAGALAPLMHAPALAQAPATALRAVKRTLDVDGKAASVFGLLRDNGAPGLALGPGERFNVRLTNNADEPTIIHWHGLTPPWPLDGVADKPAPLMKDGEARSYDFAVADPGTYWMHAHTLQEQNLMAAPLIVRSAEDAARDEQEIVVLLHDFSFTPAAELLARLKNPADKDAMGGMDMSKMDVSHMSHEAVMEHMARMGAMMQGDMMGAMDLNDIDYDAYLANDRTLADPEVVRVEAGGRVRLRIINGAAATAFSIDSGALPGELIAVDGQEIEPVAGSLFPISMAQRLDIRLTLPKAGGAFPILALREGARERAGIILASAGAPVAKLPVLGPAKGPVVGLDLESRLRARRPLALRPADRRQDVILTGNMANYSWAMRGGDMKGVKLGERVELTMLNMSMMTHPMHLHGHHFQVVGVNGKALPGAVRDTVAVPPMTSVTIAFDAENPGIWAFHCHHLYHMVTGMMAFVAYEGVG